MQGEKLEIASLIEDWKKKLSDSFDVTFRQIYIKEKECWIVFLSSLSDGVLVAGLVESIVQTVNDEAFVYYPGSVTSISNQEEAMILLLSGQSIVVVEDGLFAIETRSYPSRPNAEPQVEKSIRGSHDGFVENIILNVGLIRRRIRDPRLTIVLNKIGSSCKSDVACLYLKEIADVDVLEDVTRRINALGDTEILNERNLCELLYGKTINPYPHVRYSERPDLCAIHLLQGYVVLLVDNSPTAMILPTTFFELNSQIEEYTQTPIIATFTRILRLLAIWLSIYFIPLWIVLVATQNPTRLQLHLVEDVNLFGFGFSILFADIAVEWIRQALIHTPDMLSSIMGFIAVFVLGDMAIGLGAYSEEILLVVALCNIGNLLTPNYELSLANKFFRIVISCLSLLFGLSGFCIGVLFHVSVLLSTKSMKYPYLYPLCPFSFRECKKQLFGKMIQIDS